MGESPILMSIYQLIDSVNGICLCNNSPDKGFSSVVTDSRNALPGSLFVPLRGEFQDGHGYIPKAITAGARVILVDEQYARDASGDLRVLGETHDACVIVVKNTLTALQDAACMYVSFFPELLKIGITGSSGKTTTKEIVGSILAQKYSVIMNEGNLNSETGLPLSVFNIRKGHQIGIFELGMNRRGEIAEIARVLSPSLALITNIGTAHIGILGSQMAIAEEKKSIFKYFDSKSTAFIPEDNNWCDFLSDIESGEVIPFGPKRTVGFEGSRSMGIDGTIIQYDGLEINFPLPGKHNLSNAFAAISLARHIRLTAGEIKTGLEKVKPLFGRSDIYRGDITILIDCYNANPDSMESALVFCDDLEWNGNKIYVLGSMLELGEESPKEHQRICSIVSASSADSVFLFGDDMIASGHSCDWKTRDVRFFSSIEELSSALSLRVKKGDLVLLKGSRGMALERVCAALNVPAQTERHNG